MARRGLVLVLVLLANGCGDNLHPPPKEPSCADATIGLLGGTVAAPTGATLVIPPGAITTTTEITLCKATTEADAAGDGYVAGPPSVVFARPVELTLPVDPAHLATSDANPVEIRFDAPDGSRHFLQSTFDRTAGTVHTTVPGLGYFIPLQTSGGMYITSSLALSDAVVGQSYAVTLSASGGTPPYMWSFLPGSSAFPGMALAPDGELSEIATMFGVFTTFVVVSDASGHSLAAALTQNIDPAVAPLPELDALSPAFAQQGSAPLAVLVLGQNFVPSSEVMWDGGAITSSYLDSTHLAVTLSSTNLATSGMHQVRVTTPAPGGGTSNNVVFTVRPPNPAPVLATVDPMTLPVSMIDFQITLHGSNFISTSTVAADGTPIPTQYVSSTQLSAEVPATYLGATGTLQITVTNPSPGGGTSGAVAIDVVPDNPVPVLSSLSSTSAMLDAPAFTLHATGTGFTSSSVVYFGSSSLVTTFVDSDDLDAVVPASFLMTLETVAVTVVNPAPAGGTSNAISFAIGGGCSWSTTATIAVGGNPRAIATGDFNGDGHRDLVDANFADKTITVLAGDGTGGFTVASTTSTGPSPMTVVGPMSAAVQDVNHDGKLDVLDADYCNLASTCTADLLLGNGDGTFQAARSIAIGSGPNNTGELVIADFNRDGNEDFAVGNDYDASVFLGDGTGGFSAGATLQVRAGGYVVRGVASADFNGDGKPDLVVTDQGLSGEGIMGVAGVFLGDGAGGFAAPEVLTAGAGTFSVQTADFNGDGHVDIAVTNNFDATVSVFLGNGSGSFGSAITTPVAGSTAGNLTDLAVADFDGDDHLDIAALNSGPPPNGFAVLMLGKGDGTFQGAATIDLGDFPAALAVADFDGNGVPDVATTNQVANTVTIATSTCP